MAEPEKDVVTWEELDRLVERLAEQLANRPAPDVVLPISRGGLVPAGMLGYRLGWRKAYFCNTVLAQLSTEYKNTQCSCICTCYDRSTGS